MTRVTLISHSDTFYSTRRLMTAGAALGLTMARVDPVRVLIELHPDRPRLTEDGAEVPLPDVVLPRIGSRLAKWSLGMLGAWMAAGAKSPVRPEAIARAADKLATTERLVLHGLPVLPTLAIRERYHIPHALDALGGDAWVIKRRKGTGGDGVALVHDRRSARSVLEALIRRGQTVLVQPFVALERARDLRVLVLGGEPVAAAWRHAAQDEFRANIHRGGRAAPAELGPEARDLAARAARAMELPFCGVDLIETPSGLVLLEVNGSPGLEGIEAATGRDLATPYIERWVASAQATAQVP